MRLRNNAWTFEGVLSKDMCDEIIAQGLAAKIVKGDTANKNINKKRDSQIAWLYDPNIMQMLERYIQIANREAGWNFQWDSVKAIQFTQYKSEKLKHKHEIRYPYRPRRRCQRPR